MLAMHWLMCPSTAEKATAAGLPEGIAGYAVGRLGVLGDCSVDDLVTAAFFWEPEYMRTQATAGRAVKSPHEGAAVYVQLCQEWGTQHLDGFDGNERLSELAGRVVNAALPDEAPTFAGWRDQSLPDTGPARTMQLMQTMRELGFARHCSAVQAAAMSPVEAIMSGPTGAWNARFFGWSEPYPDGEPLRDARNEIEADGNIRHAADFEVLTDDERDEFVALAKGARNYAGERVTPETGAALPN